ncbi:MAG: hypothetical protein FJZ64_03265, partial [Chlamydiae bacterium]|nr:hypothetical protein [Chlamydiota bacterium]
DSSRKTSSKISGDDAFKLKDTYGFPIEEILLIAKDENLTVDLARVSQLEEEAKEKSRKAHKTIALTFESNFFADFVKTHPTSQFDYHKTALDTQISASLSTGNLPIPFWKDKKASSFFKKPPSTLKWEGKSVTRVKLQKAEILSKSTTQLLRIQASSLILGK